MTTPTTHPTRWLLLALPLLLALAIYHPFQNAPLDIWDYREFLPILQRTHGAFTQFAALLEYYAHHGRMNPLLYVTFVVERDWFGTNASGWQWLRFAWMSLDVVLLVLIAQRAGLRFGAGVAAAALVVTATPAVRAWVQLMAEPQAVAALLGALFIALNYQAMDRWRRAAAGITLLIAAAFLSKEVTGSLGIVVLVVALSWQRPAGRSLRSSRDLTLIAALAIVAFAELILLMWVRSRPAATGYGMAYGSAPISLSRFGADLIAIAMPVRPGTDARLGLLYPANVLAIIVLALGLTVRLRRKPADRKLAAVIALGILPPLIGAAVYLPWPKFDSFYGLPFLMGPVLLFAAAVDELLAQHGSRRAFAVLAAVLIPCYAAIAANRSVETAAASLRLNADFARLLARFRWGDTVLVLSPPDGPHALPVKPDELRDYAAALGWLDTTRAAVILPVPCDRFNPAIGPVAPGPAFVSYSYGCGRIPDSVLRINSEFIWHDWLTLATIRDTMALDFSGAVVQEMLRHKSR